MSTPNQQNSQPTVFIIDDDDSVRKSLARLLSTANIRTESFASAEAFLAREDYNGIGVIILDIRMSGLDGMELHEQLIKLGSNLPIIFLSGHADIPTSVRAMKRGAMHFLTKPVGDIELLQAVREALNTHTKRNNEIAEQDAIRAQVNKLTTRELEVMRHVISGAINKQIAAQLDIAEKTVKVHRANVMKKVGAESIVDLVRLCNTLDITPLNISPKISSTLLDD
ncbi:MAG: response regulator [Gammaproteobacteria bacterium]|jgi:FixJ family two-component response regulator